MNRETGEVHRAVLRVACDQQGMVVLGAGGKDLGPATQHDPAEPAPVFVPAVGDKRRLRVFQDVAQPLQRNVAPFRLFIDHDVEAFAVHDIAYRDQVRRAGLVGGREMPDPVLIEEPALTLRSYI